MSSAKEYMDFEETSASIKSILDKLSRISYNSFIPFETQDELFVNAIDLLELMEKVLTEFFITHNLNETPIKKFYENIEQEAYLGNRDQEFFDNEGFVTANMILNNHTHYSFYSALHQDYIYSIFSELELLKKAIISCFRLKRAIIFSWERYGNTILINKLNQLNNYAISIAKKEAFIRKLLADYPETDSLKLVIAFKEDQYNELDVKIESIVSWAETQDYQNEFISFLKNLKNLLTQKIEDLGISQHQLMADYKIELIPS
ncbi:hypothetical protein [Nostoc sp. WHI]|uniref:hypothetical protein n=1 Tax=Nostoc sp. WHI TaxID=2650611 RepID=UPI0018C68B48|nr:hypothetical protein [Nostoc sp. WHI]MBG1271601.1 hypothetical protein [Nostoc sp. WHI]